MYKQVTVEDLLISFIAMGYDEERFWHLTPKLYDIYKRASIEKVNSAYETDVIIAYLNSIFTKSSKHIKIETFVPSLKSQPIDNNDELISDLIGMSEAMPKMTWEEFMNQHSVS